MEYPIKLKRAVAPRLAVSAILYAAAFIAMTAEGIAMNCGIDYIYPAVRFVAFAVTVIAAIAIPVFCKVKHKRLNAFDMLTVAILFLLILFDLLYVLLYFFMPAGPYTYTVERRWYFFYTTIKIFNYEWMYGDAEMWEGQELPEGFQRAEYLLEHGQIDAVVDRRELKKTLGDILRLHGKPERRKSS